MADAGLCSSDESLGEVEAYFDAEDSLDDTQLNVAPMPLQSGRFSAQTNQILENLYARGMNGWEKAHTSEIEEALSSTDLDLPRLQVPSSSSV